MGSSGGGIAVRVHKIGLTASDKSFDNLLKSLDFVVNDVLHWAGQHPGEYYATLVLLALVVWTYMRNQTVRRRDKQEYEERRANAKEALKGQQLSLPLDKPGKIRQLGVEKKRKRTERRIRTLPIGSKDEGIE